MDYRSPKAKESVSFASVQNLNLFVTFSAEDAIYALFLQIRIKRGKLHISFFTK